MLFLGLVGPMIELRKLSGQFNLPKAERVLLNNFRSGSGSLGVYKVNKETWTVSPTDITTMSDSEIPEGFCLGKKYLSVKLPSGEDLVFPGRVNYGLIREIDLVDEYRSMTPLKEERLCILNTDNPKFVQVVDRVTLTDLDCIKIASSFESRFPIYGFSDKELTKVIYRRTCMDKEDKQFSFWATGVKNVIWSPVAKLLFGL